MKTSLPLLNSLGFQNASQKAAYAAYILAAATVSNPQVQLSPAVPPRPPVLGIAAVIAPAVVAVKGWDSAIQISYAVSTFRIEAYLPYASNIAMLGSASDAISGIKEVTPGGLIIDKWLAAKASTFAETISSEPLTLEQYLYKYALQLISDPLSTSSVNNIIYSVAGVPTACKHLILNLAATNYDINNPVLQLSKIGVVPPHSGT